MTEIARLRRVSEEDVIAALENASFGAWSQDEGRLLELFNLMLDTVLGKEAGDGMMWPGRRPLQQ